MKYDYVGKRIREERLKYGLSLNDLAKATGLSPSFLSMLENGKTMPSLKVLDKLCTYFSIHMASLFEGGDVGGDLLHYPESKQVVLSGDSERVLRLLLPRNRSGIEPVLVTLYPGNPTYDYTSHKGIEFGYVIEGVIEVHIKDRDPIVCRKGDSVIYRSTSLHKLVNPTEEVARGIWIGIPGAESF